MAEEKKQEIKTKGRKFICLWMIYSYAMFVTVSTIFRPDQASLLVGFHVAVVTAMAVYMGANAISKKFQK